MSQQLVKKDSNGRYSNVMPKSWIEAIKDKNTGQTLVEILQGFNMYFLPYNGNTSATRCSVPMILRKKGLWITYVKYDGNVYTEWYAASDIDDKSWGDSSNWRIGNNTLVGDITISANGNWVINGAESEFKAVGEKGNTPLIRVANNRLQVSYDLGDTYRNVTENPVYTQFRNYNNKIQVSTDLGATWIDASDEIAAYFRWQVTTGDTQANNVGRLQISRDNKTWTNLSNNIVNNLHISKYIGANEQLPTSGIAEGTIYAKGPTYAVEDTSNSNPIYRLWVYAWKGNILAWQDNGEFTSIAAGIVQETGSSENAVMSQKATSEKFTEIEQGIIYDVSARNDGAVFESLSALLSSPNLSTLIPTPVRRGGITIRFIQSSDNKYVQYRYLETAISGSPNPFLDASNWLGINEEYIAIKNTVLGIDSNAIAGYKLDVKNTLIKADGWGVSDYIDVPEGNFQVYFSNGASTNYLVFVDDNEVIKGTVLLNNNTGGQAVTIPSDATKFRFTFSLDYDNVRCAYLSNVFYRPILSKESIDNRVLSIEALINDGFVFAGIANLNTQPVSPTEKVFYIATLKGTYTNFNNIIVDTNDVIIIKSNGGTWVKQVLGIKPKSKFYYNEDIHIFNELYISPSVTWTDLYIRVTSITGGWRVILGDLSDFSENYKAVDITDANLGLIQNVNNIIFFSLDPEKLYNTGVKRGNIDVARNPVNSPCCYASYLNLNTKNDLTTLINNRVTPIDNRVTTLENTINGQVGNCTTNKYLNTNGTEIDAIGFAISDYIDVPAGNFQVYYSSKTMNGKYLIFYDNNGNKVGNSVNLNNQAGGQAVTVQEGATKFRFSFDMNYNNVRASYLSIPIYTPIYPTNGLQGNINDLQEENAELSQSIDIIQNGKAGNCHIGYYLNTYGNEVTDNDFAISDYVNVTGGTRIQVYYSNQSEIGKFLIGYDSNNEKVQVQQLNTGGGVAVDLLSTVTKIRFSFKIAYTDARVVANKVVIYTPVIPVLSILDASKEYVDNKIISSNDSLMFTLIDDDFTNTTACIALAELCESLGIHCSFALMPNYADDRVTPSIPADKLNIVKDFEERGFSFAMHPNHSLFYGAGGGTVGTLAEREKCLVKTQRLFDKEGILYGSKILVWPGSSDTINSEEAIPIAQRNVEIAIHAGAYGGVFVNTKDQFASMRYKMVRLSLDFNENRTKTKIKSDIDSAVSNGKGLVIFICHTHMHWVDQTTIDETTKSWPNLVEILTYAASKGVPFVSMKEAYMRRIEPEYMPTLILKNM